MAGVEDETEILQEILNSSGPANEEEIVHIIQDEDVEGEEGAGMQESEEEANSELVFWVPPLLAVGREVQRVNVTQAELQRRVLPPECLSQTMLLSLLRLSKEKGRELRQTLARNGIKKLTSKSAVISSFTRLTETEAAQLAEDYFYLASRNLKLKEISQEVVGARGGWERFEEQANMMKDVLEHIVREVEVRDTPLTLMTHGFSPLILRAVVDIITEIITYREPPLHSPNTTLT